MILLTHKRMLDAAVLIQGTWTNYNGDQVWGVTWFNRRGLCLGKDDIILIKKEEARNWYAIEV